MRITNDGKVAIGTSWDSDLSSDFKLFVRGGIRTDYIRIDIESGWADFVFNKNYHLIGIKELESYIKRNHHLPGLPTNQEVIEAGINIGETTKVLLQKIEELTLYVIELKKENEALDKKIINLSK